MPVHGAARSAGPETATAAYTAWVADGRPWKDAQPVRALGDRLAAHGYTVYYHGDDRHLQADPPEDHTPFSATGWPGQHPYPYCLATDIMPPAPGQTSKLTGRLLPSLAALAARLRQDRIDGHPAAAWIKYMNWTTAAGDVVHDKWQPDYVRTTSTDAGHIHVSCRTDLYATTAADSYDLVARTEGTTPVITEGVDYSFARPSPTGLAAAGKKFAVRYVGPGTDGKHLHADELAALRAAGLDVVANAEGSAGGFTGATAGRDWATSADAACRALGMPADRPIYFSVDFDAGSADWPGIDAALRAAAAVIGAARVGVYGSYATVAHCRAAGTAAWFWQTYAWSNGLWQPWAHMQQYRNGVTIAGGDCDLTRATVADYGQWGFNGGDPDMSFDEDKIPISYPAPNPANPTWTGPNALGNARDMAAEARDRIKALQTTVDLYHKAVLTAIQGVNEEAVLAAVREEAERIRTQLAAEATQEQADVQELLDAIRSVSGGGGDLTPEALERALAGFHLVRAAPASGSDWG